MVNSLCNPYIHCTTIQCDMYLHVYSCIHLHLYITLHMYSIVPRSSLLCNKFTYSTRKKTFHSIPSRHRSNGVNMTNGLLSRDRCNSKHGTRAHFCNGGVTTNTTVVSTLNTVSFVRVCVKRRLAFQPGVVLRVTPRSSCTL